VCCRRLEAAEQISELLDAAPHKEPHSCSAAHNPYAAAAAACVAAGWRWLSR
jgi:hypothetical protein